MSPKRSRFIILNIPSIRTEIMIPHSAAVGVHRRFIFIDLTRYKRSLLNVQNIVETIEKNAVIICGLTTRYFQYTTENKNEFFQSLLLIIFQNCDSRLIMFER